LESALIDWCRKRISHIKSPRRIDFRAELPRTPTGKLLKRRLWDKYWNGNRMMENGAKQL
jgi:fatty-acyl-CoA synthase